MLASQGFNVVKLGPLGASQLRKGPPLQGRLDRKHTAPAATRKHEISLFVEGL
jgi:hypothetical protein